MLKMRHPNVVLFMGSCMSDTKLYMVTELLEKGSLHQMYKSGGHLDPGLTHLGLTLSIGLDGSRGMQYLHSLDPPVIHR